MFTCNFTFALRCDAGGANEAIELLCQEVVGVHVTCLHLLLTFFFTKKNQITDKKQQVLVEKRDS